MNELIHPKRLRLFIEHLYLTYPIVKSNPDYSFFYLYTNYREPSEYLFVVIDSYLLNQKIAEDINKSLEHFALMFGFTSSTIITSTDLEEKIKTQVIKQRNHIKGSNYNYLFCEVW